LRQASAGVALLRLGQEDKVWPLLKHSPDPRVRSYLIHRLAPRAADPAALFGRLEQEKDVSIRRALLLAAGEFELPPGQRKRLLPRVLQLYQEEQDAGLHGSAEWLLRHWKQEARLKELARQWAKDREKKETQIRQELKASPVPSGPGGKWYVNGQGQTMVVVPGPSTFRMGSPVTEAGREGGPKGIIETLHRKRIGRTFAIAAHEVTVGQFRRFRKDHQHHETYSPGDEHPVNQVMWYDAAAYCNWLSDQEGIPPEQWCYEPKKGKDVRDWSREAYGEGMRLRENYLSLEGYRLPSEAEWECACRAGSLTSRYYGETEALLGRYAWYTKNSQDRGMLLPGSRKPNDLGLFDMLGNAMEWCQEPIFYYRPGHPYSKDKEYKREIESRESRVLRGGAFADLAVIVRSANRYGSEPAFTNGYVGFRPARTFPTPP
jgi:formylglycine-generating enzyme required for sulfatase activity